MSLDRQELGRWLTTLVFDRDVLERIYSSCKQQTLAPDLSFGSFLANFEQSSAHTAEELLASWLKHGSDTNKLVRRARARMLNVQDVAAIWRPSEHDDVLYKAQNGLHLMLSLDADAFLATLRITAADSDVTESSQARIVLQSRRIDDIQNRLLEQESADAHICRMTGIDVTTNQSRHVISQFCQQHPFYLSISRIKHAFELEAYLDDVESFCVKLNIEPRQVVLDCYKQYEAIHEWLRVTQLSNASTSPAVIPRSSPSHHSQSQISLLSRQKRKRGDSFESISPVKRARLHTSISRHSSAGLSVNAPNKTACWGNRLLEPDNQTLLSGPSEKPTRLDDQIWDNRHALPDQQQRTSNSANEASRISRVVNPESLGAKHISSVKYIDSPVLGQSVTKDFLHRLDGEIIAQHEARPAERVDSSSQVDHAPKDHMDVAKDDEYADGEISESDDDEDNEPGDLQEESDEHEEQTGTVNAALFRAADHNNNDDHESQSASEDSESEEDESSRRSSTTSRISAVAIMTDLDGEKSEEDEVVLQNDSDTRNNAHSSKDSSSDDEHVSNDEKQLSNDIHVASSDGLLNDNVPKHDSANVVLRNGNVDAGTSIAADEGRQRSAGDASDIDASEPEESEAEESSSEADTVEQQAAESSNSSSESSDEDDMPNPSKVETLAPKFDDHVDATAADADSEGSSADEAPVLTAHSFPPHATGRRSKRSAPPLHKIMKTVMKSMKGEAESASESSSSEESSEDSDNEDEGRNAASEARRRLEFARPLLTSQQLVTNSDMKSEDEAKRKSSAGESRRASAIAMTVHQDGSESDSSSVVSEASTSFAITTLRPSP